MNAQRDELGADIRAVDGNHDLGAAALADKLADLGWSKPRQAGSVDDLDSLPMGSVIRSEGVTAIKAQSGAWLWDDGDYWEPIPGYEVSVLFTPGSEG